MAIVDRNNMNPAVSPLLCWDFFMEGYQRIMRKGDDIAAINKLAKQMNWASQWDYQNTLVEQDNVIVITDPKINIVFASSNIVEMTGYQATEMRGKTPKFLQGAKTDPVVSAFIRNKITEQQPFDTVVINYTKTGNPYHCHIKGFPVFNKENILVNFIAFENAA